MGLIQSEIERQGVATVGISIVRRFSEERKPPRTVVVKWPMGHPLGEPGNAGQQTALLKKAIEALETIKTPGAIIDLPYRWKERGDWG